ncbi:hypothetical protein J8273_1521 [Carpediemonas membranifera]|uniref:Uncharacterized protein n=1 Tax=Carpediemonas membranifera TaxID=201153 RepID=A0A8J6AXE8_9EUKA|nr:hypothetical protein J8273_1521 [Carpediemonas membranifera]|eukprot:KAG9396523.1 hypothetical protein J8273_1521 [Carpediemonas membranifera]
MTNDKTRRLEALDIDSYVDHLLWYDAYRSSRRARPFHHCLGGDVKRQALMEYGIASVDEYDPPRVDAGYFRLLVDLFVKLG